MSLSTVAGVGLAVYASSRAGQDTISSFLHNQLGIPADAAVKIAKVAPLVPAVAAASSSRLGSIIDTYA